MQFPKTLASVRTNITQVELNTLASLLEENSDLISMQPSIQFEGFDITKFYYNGLAYQAIQEHGLVVDLKLI